MPKSILKDMVVKPRPVAPAPPVPPSAGAPPTYTNANPRARLSGGKFKWVILTLVLVGIGFYLWAKFGSVLIKVTPRQQNVVLSDTLEVPYETIVVEATESVNVLAAGSKYVQTRASGKIVVYNKQSSSQVLVANTRFQAPNGNIYRSQERVIIAANGSVEITVVADAPGEKYNIGLVDFTLPALQGTSRYSKVYARSKTSMTGGFAGNVKTVAPSDLEKAKDTLVKSLQERLTSEAKLQLPGDFVLYDDGIILELGRVSEPAATDKSNTAVVSQSAKLSGLAINKAVLSQVAATATVEDYEGEDVVIENLGDLKVSFPGKGELKIGQDKAVSVRIEGEIKLVWSFNEEGLKRNLVGASRDGFPEVLKKFPSIQKAEAVFNPPWMRSFPGKLERIKIEKII